MVKQREHIAKLVIHNLPNLGDEEIVRIVNWLKICIKTINRGDRQDFHKVFTMRLMKE